MVSVTGILILLIVAVSATKATENHPYFSNELLSGARAGTEDDISELVDQSLATVRGLIKSLGLGTLPLPNATIIEFSELIIGINITGKISLYDGLLKGIDTLHRTGDAIFIQETNGDILVDLEIGFYDIYLEYSFFLQFMELPPIKATFGGELSRFSIQMALRISSEGKISVEKFLITDTGFLRVSVKGLGIILNFIGDLIGNIVGNMAKRMLVELIQGPILELINAILEGLIPREMEGIMANAQSFVAGKGEPSYYYVKL